jgi:hypothetical protein
MARKYATATKAPAATSHFICSRSMPVELRNLRTSATADATIAIGITASAINPFSAKDAMDSRYRGFARFG